MYGGWLYIVKNSKKKLAALLSDGSLCVVELPSIETWEELEGKEFIVEASHTEMVFGSILHLVWLDSHKLLSVSHYGFIHSNDLFQTSLNKDALPSFFLQEIELECSEDIVPGLPTCSGWHATVSKQNNLKELIIGIAPNHASKSSAFMQFSEGKIKEYLSKMGTGGSLEQEFQGFSAVCPRMGVALVKSVGQSKPVLFGLDKIGRLHTSGGIVVCKLQQFFHFTQIWQTNNSKKKEENENYIHIWERGAKIVGVLHGDEVATILQTTRGNLECRSTIPGALENSHVDNKVSSILMAIRKALQEHFTESPARETCYKADRKPSPSNPQNSHPGITSANHMGTANSPANISLQQQNQTSISGEADRSNDAQNSVQKNHS
ncbi:hypothetical protein KIW84_030790 [Lathyrus oleraceus]|uniref:ELP1 N-terminal second beta-propeller domain-containing protein n=1 Tax=Pisum sativum TaxID=3888 RepID=A0A9D5AZF5_PEA|nr:hypothetical protein KIW84_030790 [Pisum sativum]